jgi:hypothetical protein
MMHIAKAHGMHIANDHGSSEATIQLDAYDASSVLEEMLGEGMAIVENTNNMIRNMWFK